MRGCHSYFSITQLFYFGAWGLFCGGGLFCFFVVLFCFALFFGKVLRGTPDWHHKVEITNVSLFTDDKIEPRIRDKSKQSQN